MRAYTISDKYHELKYLFSSVSKIPSTPSTPITPRTPGTPSSVSIEAESPGGKKRDSKSSTTRRRVTRTRSKPLETMAENDVINTDSIQSQSSTDGPTENILCLTCAYTFTKKGGRETIIFQADVGLI